MPTYRNAHQFLEAVFAYYKSLQSYSDVGVVRQTWAPEPLTCWFESDFEAPGRFRFQFIRPHPSRRLYARLTKYIIGSDGKQAYFYTEERGSEPVVELEESLKMAVAGATGISRGSAYTIGHLLLECVDGFSLLMLSHLRFRRSAEFDGVLCHRVSGLHGSWGRVTLWIGANDMLLRRSVHHRSRSEEVRFNIRVDTPLPEGRLNIPSVKPAQSGEGAENNGGQTDLTHV
jgi:hypothetical protein